ncbi:MAG: hypothetical protein H7319_15345 [Spirosoma sp.]|nr:hypothetical protein [Spirosoma sp.]
MQTAKDITALRKNGQLADAFALATDLLTTEPDNIWTKRAMGWVRFERLRAVAKSKTPDAFLTEWEALALLVADNPADETMLTNQAVWQAVVALFSLGDTDKAVLVLAAVFASVQTWTIEKPSDMYSALLRSFMKAGKTWGGLGDFMAWWQLSNLRPEDYLPGMTNDARKMMSLAEQAYITYAKQVLQRPDPATIQTLIADLETLHQQHPEYQYPPYYQAKLLVATGSKDEAMTALLPFARRKQNEFWLWSLLADLYHDEPEKAIACLCRAMTCPTEEKFLVNARLDLAVKLNQVGKVNEALTELTKSTTARQNEGWHVMPGYTDAVDRLAAKGGVVLTDNKPLYRQYRAMADELLYADVPEHVGVVTSLNTDKKIAHIAINPTISTHIKYEKSMARIQPGDFVAVRLDERTGKEGTFWVPLSAKRTDEKPSEGVYKPFSGVFSRIVGKEFGFIDGVFISPNLVVGVEDGSMLTGFALPSFDKIRQKHGWRAISANNSQSAPGE